MFEEYLISRNPCSVVSAFHGFTFSFLLKGSYVFSLIKKNKENLQLHSNCKVN